MPTEANEAVAMPMPALLGRHLVVAHDGGLLDERLDAAEARADARELDGVDHAARRRRGRP